MSYTFKPDDDDVAAGLRRIALSQIDAALAEIDDDGLPVAERVHQLRKRCKKLRGLIRLVRPAFDDYTRENAAFRDLAGQFSGIRDAAALVETCDALAGHFSELLDPDALAPIARALAAEARTAEAGDGLGAALDRAREELREARARAAGWSLDEDGWTVLAGGLARTFGRARAAMAAARAAPDAVTMHEWRKRVKYHRAHVRLLRGMDDCLLPGHLEASSRLADILGEHHDLHVFADRLAMLDDIPPGTREAVTGLLGVRRDRLAAAAFDLGPRILTERPRHLVRRWRPLWKGWRRDARDG